MVHTILTFLFTAAAFVVVLGILIIVHEFGHFIVAKLCGVKVLEFAIGFPPRIVSFKRGETQYTIGLIPMGGYVKMLGEEEVSTDKRAYNRQTPGKRFAIGIAGVLMNILLAWLILSIGFASGMAPLATPASEIKGDQISTKIVIAEVTEKGAADQAGIKVDDQIVSANVAGSETVFKSADGVTEFTTGHLSQTALLTLKRDDTTITKEATISSDKEAPLGIAMSDQSAVKVVWYRAPIVAFQETFKLVAYMWDFLKSFFARLFTHGQISNEVGGPVAIFSMSGMAARAGVMIFFQFIALLSINLALINILPFPALDGGRLLFILLEKIWGKRIVKEEIENIIHLVGFALLILLILAITYKDILRYFHK